MTNQGLNQFYGQYSNKDLTAILCGYEKLFDRACDPAEVWFNASKEYYSERINLISYLLDERISNKPAQFKRIINY